MNGWTSTVSLGDVMTFAGRRTGFESAGREHRNRLRILSICVLICGSIGVACFLPTIISISTLTLRTNIDIVRTNYM